MNQTTQRICFLSGEKKKQVKKLIHRTYFQRDPGPKRRRYFTNGRFLQVPCCQLGWPAAKLTWNLPFGGSCSFERDHFSGLPSDTPLKVGGEIRKLPLNTKRLSQAKGMAGFATKFCVRFRLSIARRKTKPFSGTCQALGRAENVEKKKKRPHCDCVWLSKPFWDPILENSCTTDFRTYFSGWIGMFTGFGYGLLTHGHMKAARKRE